MIFDLDKNKLKRFLEGFRNSAGITIIEIMVVLFISSIVIGALVRFISIAHPVSKITLLQQRSTETARLQLKRISKALREAQNSDTGAYPLVEMSSQRIIFYSDIDQDATTERIRYELSGTNLIRGLTEPTGNPLIYDMNNEESTVIASTIVNGIDDIFTYYTGDYPEDQTALTPVDLTEVKYIQFKLLIDADVDNDPAPIEVVSQVQLRNLKTNLGESVN